MTASAAVAPASPSLSPRKPLQPALRHVVAGAVERGIGPDATIHLDFALHRMAGVIERLIVYPENMARNLALLGGLVVVTEDDDGPVWCRLEPPADLRIALFVPEFDMPTHESRQRLPESISRNQAVHNIGRAALIVGAITQRRYDVLRVATEDILHQPARSTLFPAMYPIFEAARTAGAHGVYLSGGGSTIAALVTGHEDAVTGAMREAAAILTESTTRVTSSWQP